MGEWRGGKYAGVVHVRERGVEVRLKANGKVLAYRWFGHCGDPTKALECAEKWRRLESDRLGLTKNKYRIIGNYAEVQLTREKVMKVSIQDLPIVEARTWHFGSDDYAISSSCISEGGLRSTYRFHREICPSDWEQVDHINRDRLDNRRENLRKASNALNQRNRVKQKNNTSGHTGISVVQHKRSGTSWQFQWHEDGKARKRSWGFAKYGEEAALQMSLQHRDNVWKRLNITHEK